MKLNIDKQNNKFIQFTIDTPVEYANAIRRCLLTNIPTYALDNLIIHENTSLIDNDMVSQRIYMIPIIKGKNVYFSFEKINETEEPIHIFSHDLSTDLVKDIYILSLKPLQKIKLECSSKFGVASMNIKWSCITDLTYKQHRKLIGNFTDIEFNNIQTIIPQFKMKQLTEFIDTNLIFMINQICERDVFKVELMDKFTISFSCIDEKLPFDIFKLSLTQLIQAVLHPKIKGNKLETNDFSVPNLLMLEHPDKNFTCTKQHNLDTYFLLSNPDNLEPVQEQVVKNLHLLLDQLQCGT